MPPNSLKINRNTAISGAKSSDHLGNRESRVCLSLVALTAIAFAAQAHSQHLVCDVTDQDNPSFFFEVTGDLILMHWPGGSDGGSMLLGVWRCDKSASRPDGDTQCTDANPKPGTYSTIKILPEEGIALLAWGNFALDNHVVTYDPIECQEVD
jgi:hypothetical protein